jgi:hypothetical protein
VRLGPSCWEALPEELVEDDGQINLVPPTKSTSIKKPDKSPSMKENVWNGFMTLKK